MAGLPLANFNIVVTRPRDQSQGLAASLRALGANPVMLPLLEIAPAPDQAALQAFVQHAADYQLLIFISPNAVHKLQMGNELIEFSARFAGVARQLSVPVANVYALYARETGHGMTFEVDLSKPAPQAEADTGPVAPPAALPAPDEPEPPAKPPAGKPTLRRVK